MCEWIPPYALIDWDKIMSHVRRGVLWDGFHQYTNWHCDLKRRAGKLSE
jgi:hypothetical protein